jgi:uncharacterized protein YceK
LAVTIARDGATMRASRFTLLAVVLSTQTGCGTFHNLKDPPDGPMFMGTGATYPLGGTVRSGLLAIMGPPCGLAGVVEGNKALIRGEFEPGLKHLKEGLLLTAAGLGAIVDTPLSLAGDIVTLPVAYARSKEYRWATWWNDNSLDNRPTVVPVPEDASDTEPQSR